MVTIDVLVAPVLHEYVFAPTAVKLALCPVQMPEAPITLMVGLGLTVTANVGVLPKHPNVLLPVRV